jgi:hypothetical protein
MDTTWVCSAHTLINNENRGTTKASQRWPWLEEGRISLEPCTSRRVALVFSVILRDASVISAASVTLMSGDHHHHKVAGGHYGLTTASHKFIILAAELTRPAARGSTRQTRA